MAHSKHRVFISYHHANDQAYKKALLDLNDIHDIFVDASVDTGDIDDEGLDDEAIRQKIRDEYLKDSSVTIVLVGLETKNRKHVDWEIYSSMFSGKVNKQSGVLVINLPGVCTHYRAAHGDAEKRAIYPENSSWITITSREECEKRHPYVPARIIDNLLKKGAKVSITNWDKIAENAEALQFLIDVTFDDRASCEYDLSRPMRRADS